MQLITNTSTKQHPLLNYLSTGVFTINTNYEVTLWNSNIENWTHIKNSSIIGKTLYSFFPSFNNSLYKKLLQNVFNDGMTIIFSSKLHPLLFRTKHNNELKLHTTVLPVPNEEGNGFNALFSIEDQTTLTDLVATNRHLSDKLQASNTLLEQKIKERTSELKRTNLRLSSILNSAPSSIILLNDELKIISVNYEGLNYLNTDEKSALNSKICDVINCSYNYYKPKNSKCSKCDIERVIQQTLKTGKKNHKIECSLKRATENNKTYESTLLVSTTKIKANNNENLLLILDDITERKQMEQELIKTKNKAVESDRLKSAFLANMSHEIRTPLNGIVGLTDLIINCKLTQEDKKQYSKLIAESSDQLVNQIDSIIDISKLESNQLNLYQHDVDANKIIDNIYIQIKEKEPDTSLIIKTQKDQPDQPCNIKTDQVRLTQVLNNLISNAFKFTTKGSIEFGYFNNNLNLVFFVKDTGAGIPKQLHKIIFKPFRQAREATQEIYRGAGLGLAISKGLVNKLGGKIWLESEINTGSTFFFTIPKNTP